MQAIYSDPNKILKTIFINCETTSGVDLSNGVNDYLNDDKFKPILIAYCSDDTLIDTTVIDLVRGNNPSSSLIEDLQNPQVRVVTVNNFAILVLEKFLNIKITSKVNIFSAAERLSIHRPNYNQLIHIFNADDDCSKIIATGSSLQETFTGKYGIENRCRNEDLFSSFVSYEICKVTCLRRLYNYFSPYPVLNFVKTSKDYLNELDELETIITAISHFDTDEKFTQRCNTLNDQIYSAFKSTSKVVNDFYGIPVSFKKIRNYMFILLPFNLSFGLRNFKCYNHGTFKAIWEQYSYGCWQQCGSAPNGILQMIKNKFFNEYNLILSMKSLQQENTLSSELKGDK